MTDCNHKTESLTFDSQTSEALCEHLTYVKDFYKCQDCGDMIEHGYFKVNDTGQEIEKDGEAGQPLTEHADPFSLDPMIMFMGYRQNGNTYVVKLDGRPYAYNFVDDLCWSLDVAEHSPTGLEWGYLGSGPHQLAIALLREVTEDVDYAREMAQHFKEQVVVSMPHFGWRMRETVIKTWVEAHPLPVLEE